MKMVLSSGSKNSAFMIDAEYNLVNGELINIYVWQKPCLARQKAWLKFKNITEFIEYARNEKIPCWYLQKLNNLYNENF